MQDAEVLNAALLAKEEQVRRVAQEKKGLEKKLAGLERLILRGDGNGQIKVGQSIHQPINGFHYQGVSS
jgi:hypothetical protein